MVLVWAYSTGRKSSQKISFLELTMLRKAKVEPRAGLWKTCLGPKRSSIGYIKVLLPVLDGPTKNGTRQVLEGPCSRIAFREDASLWGDKVSLFPSKIAATALAYEHWPGGVGTQKHLLHT